MDVDDSELFAAWRDGDADAGNALVERCFVGVFRFFSSKVPDHADELTQQAFLGCVQARDRLQDGHEFRPYLYGIARKTLLRHFERRGQSVHADAFSRLSIADLAPSPSVAMAAGQRRDIVLRALQCLPLDHQIMIELVYWEDMPLKDVAEVIGIAEGTVKSRLHRARGRLSEEIARLVDGEPTADVEEQARWLGRDLGTGRPREQP